MLSVGDNSKVSWTTSYLGGCHSEKGKDKLAWWAELHAVFLAIMEELHSGRSPSVWVFTDSRSGQQPGYRVRQKSNGNLAY